jgi:hypothetical protein
LEDEVVSRISRFANTLVLTAAVLTLAVPTAAEQPAEANKKVLEQYFATIGSDLAAKRDSAMSTLIELTPEESKLFWPMKKAYDAELKKLFDARFDLLGEFDAIHDKLTTEKANELAERALALDEQRTDLHRRYFKKMASEISAVVAVQYLQLQSQFETMADMKIASHVPLAMR